ncbi:MAG: DJ-1/PfpI family protein, partial [Bacteroidales bacterium]|nr:DJ-1/PfpI family protein [Bacteroidales bacterium]
MKGAYIFLADGFEETEAMAPTDVLRRGGIDAKLVSIYPDRKTVLGAHNIPITADVNFTEFRSSVVLEGTDEEDVMVFPGGLPGASNLAECRPLMDLMLKHYAEGGSVAAICAAPGLVLCKLPDLKGKKFTCYDGFEPALVAQGAKYRKEGAVTDGNIVTGRGPGFAITFGLEIL